MQDKLVKSTIQAVFKELDIKKSLSNLLDDTKYKTHHKDSNLVARNWEIKFYMHYLRKLQVIWIALSSSFHQASQNVHQIGRLVKS